MKPGKEHTPLSLQLPTRRGSVLLLGAILLLSLSVTYIAWHNAKQEVRRRLEDTFNFHVHETIGRIKYRMDAYEQVLRGTRGLFVASDNVSRHEFKDYIDTLKLQERYPGIQGVGFTLIVPKQQEPQHIAEIRKQGFPDYKLRRESEQEFYTAIIYIEPFKARNLRAFGYDMYSEPVRRKALQRARDLNRAAITGKVKLLQETNKNIQAGFLMYLPVYKNNFPANTLAERRSNIIGWVYEPFRMDDFMSGLSLSLLSEIHIEIYDNKNQQQQAQMFDSDQTPNSCSLFQSQMQHIEQLDMNGEAWTMVFCSTPELEAIADNHKPQIIAITGSFLSLLLTLVTWQLLTSRSRALALATQMTRELSESEVRFRTMADSAPVLIWIAGLDSLCFWFNKTWLDFTGRSMEQELGNGWAEGVHPEDLQGCVDYYISHFQQQMAFSMEYRLKRYDGEYRWILDSGVPRFDSEGHFSGFIGSCIDITERKRAETALLRSNADLTRFAEVSAHHLMEPTRRLISYSQRLAKSLATLSLTPDTKEEMNSYLEYLQHDANRLHAMVHDIQLYLAAAEPRGPLQLEEVQSVLTQIQKRWQPKLEQLKVTLQAENLPAVFLDKARLFDLFSLIIDNALRHGLSVDPELSSQIVISGERKGKLSRYTVTDNGAGIPSEYHERIFEIFERLGRNGEAGSGIGLAIARRIVESRHGKIWIENPPHSGTRVIFELPDGEHAE